MKRLKPNRRNRRIGLIPILLALFMVFLLYDSNTRLVTSTFTLRYDKLPTAFDGYRIAQLSDLHSAVFGKQNDRLINAVSNAHPNIIVITGDLISYEDDFTEAFAVIKPLIQALTDIAPVFYVTGNHEFDATHFKDLIKILTDTSVTVLRNDYKRLTVGESSIILAGVDDPNGPADMISPEMLLSRIRSEENDPFIILLAHRNNYLSRFSQAGADLVLCGHAHGGVIRLPFIGGLIGPKRDLFPSYTSGIYALAETKMVVSRGIGNGTGFPRFLNNPELPVIVLRSA